MIKKRVIFAWGMYDLANTAFSALFVTFFFPLLIKVYLGGNEFQIGLVMGIAMFLAAIIVPFIGAYSDATKKRMPFIMVFTIICAIATGLVGFVGLYWALGLGLIATLAYHSALDIYDAKLVDISHKKNIGKISGYGVALGYVGSILSIIMAFVILKIFDWGPRGIKAIFPATAIFFLVFSIITFVFVKDKKVKGKKVKDGVKKALAELKFTFTKIRKYKGLLLFLVASFIYTDALNTAIIFLYLYGREQIGLEIIDFFFVYALMALCAAIGSLIFGFINDRLGPKKTLLITIGTWVGIIVWLMNISDLVGFTIAGCLGGAALGSVWTVTRPMLVSLSPKKKIAELFGFQGLTEKFSGVLGPIIFGFIVIRTGSYQPAMWLLLGFFVIGFLMLFKVPDNSKS